jgi:hypothetical protein
MGVWLPDGWMESAPPASHCPLSSPRPPPRAAQRQRGGVSPEGQVASMPVNVRVNFSKFIRPYLGQDSSSFIRGVSL